MRPSIRAFALLLLSSPAAEAQAPPDFYCTATTSMAGCVVALTTTNPTVAPVSGAADYDVFAVDVTGFKNGIFFFGVNGKASIPFITGTLCVAPPLIRGVIQNSGGSSPIACDGLYAQTINDGGAFNPNLDRGPGTTNWIQAWGRDPCGGYCPPFLSAGIEVTYQ